ncbi:MAG: two-component regulator propeller domain-containing protein [Fidelibacterota bacterium]
MRIFSTVARTGIVLVLISVLSFSILYSRAEAQLQLGDTLTFWSQDWGFFSGPYKAPATLRGIGNNLYVFVENAAWDSTFTSDFDIASNVINGVDVKAGNIWFGTNRGLTGYDGTNWKSFKTAVINGETSDIKKVSDVAVGEDEKVWAATDNGILVLDYGTSITDTTDDVWTNFTAENTDSGLVSNEVKVVSAGPTGMWVGTNAGVSFYDGSSWTKYVHSGASPGIISNEVFTIAFSASGDPWFGTDKGISVLFNDKWVNFTSIDGMVGDEVYGIAHDSQGNVWIGTSKGVSILDYNETLTEKSDDVWKNYTTKNSFLKSNTIYSVAIDSDGMIWFGTASGLTKYAGGFSWKT